jgi:phospholipase C
MFVLGEKEIISDVDLSKSHGWYDFSILVDGDTETLYRYAGHLETGKASFTDPLMGKMNE